MASTDCCEVRADNGASTVHVGVDVELAGELAKAEPLKQGKQEISLTWSNLTYSVEIPGNEKTAAETKADDHFDRSLTRLSS